MSTYLPSSSGWASQKYFPASTGYSSRAGTGSLRVVLDRSYDATTNTSALTVRLQGRSETYSGTFRVRQGGTFKVNGSTVQTFEQGSTGSTHFLVTDKDDTWRSLTRGTQSAATWSVTLPHDGNGRLTVTVETDFYLYYTVGGTSYVMRFVNSGSVSFTEPRGSAIASLTASASTQGVIGLTVNRYDAGYTHTAAFTCGGRTLAVSERFGTSLSQNVPRAWFDTFPDTDRLSVTVSVQTYSGANAIGEPAVGTVAVTADAGMAPALAEGFAGAAPHNEGTAAAPITGYVQRFSCARLTLDKSKVTLCNGARLASYTVTCQGERQTVASPGALETVDTAVLTVEGDTALTVTATDSRGRSASVTLTLAVMACAPPTLSAVQVFRCLSDGTPSADGTSYAAQATAGCSPLGGQNGVQSLTARAAQGSGGYGLAAALTSGALTIVPAGLDPDQRAQILLTATDALGQSAETVVTLPGRRWVMKFRADGQGVAFGGAPRGTKALELPEDWTLRFGARTWLDMAWPVGSVYLSVSPTDPGTLFGGTWERLKDRFLLAAGDTYAAGATGGSASMAHTHTMAHTHNLDDNGFAKLTAWSSDNNRVTYKEIKGVTSWTSTYRFSSSGTASYSKDSTYGVGLGGRTEGSSAANTGAASNTNNMPPYLAVYMWKRTG